MKIIDHQYNWIVTETEDTFDGFPEMTCTRCEKTGGTNQWIDFLLVHKNCEVHPDVQLALQEAVGAIYFNDSSDYVSALWDVVKALNPEIYHLAGNDIKKAFDLTHPEEGDNG